MPAPCVLSGSWFHAAGVAEASSAIPSMVVNLSVAGVSPSGGPWDHCVDDGVPPDRGYSDRGDGR
jgi:hypothetical protein